MAELKHRDDSEAARAAAAQRALDHPTAPADRAATFAPGQPGHTPEAPGANPKDQPGRADDPFIYQFDRKAPAAGGLPRNDAEIAELLSGIAFSMLPGETNQQWYARYVESVAKHGVRPNQPPPEKLYTAPSADLVAPRKPGEPGVDPARFDAGKGRDRAMAEAVTGDERSGRIASEKAKYNGRTGKTVTDQQVIDAINKIGNRNSAAETSQAIQRELGD